jgi:hypothetical protein
MRLLTTRALRRKLAAKRLGIDAPCKSDSLAEASMGKNRETGLGTP